MTHWNAKREEKKPKPSPYKIMQSDDFEMHWETFLYSSLKWLFNFPPNSFQYQKHHAWIPFHHFHECSPLNMKNMNVMLCVWRVDSQHSYECRVHGLKDVQWERWFHKNHLHHSTFLKYNPLFHFSVNFNLSSPKKFKCTFRHLLNKCFNSKH